MYRRLHVYLDPEDELDVAKFFAGSLLLSHGIRRDTVAVVRFKGLWLIARGDKVRHLRPDEETLEGWIKAVLRGSNLGVEVSEFKPSYVGFVVCLGDNGLPLSELVRLPKAEGYTVVYGLETQCDIRFRRLRELKVYMLAPLINIVIDNIYSGYI